MRVLNLYAGIGGNRKLWTGDIEVTAVEIDPEIAKIYQDLFPNDRVIVADAHQYLLEHYKEFDFIWSSPPCPTHSRMCFSFNNRKRKYPDMKLYEEIIFLKQWFKGKWVVENVISYYQPLIAPDTMGGHYIWRNFISQPFKGERKKVRNDVGCTKEVKMMAKGIIVKDFHNFKGDKRMLINNAIEPELGLHLLKSSLGDLK